MKMRTVRLRVQLEATAESPRVIPKRSVLPQRKRRGRRVVRFPSQVASEPPPPSPSRQRETTRKAFRSIVCSDRVTVCRISNISIATETRTMEASRSGNVNLLPVVGCEAMDVWEADIVPSKSARKR